MNGGELDTVAFQKEVIERLSRIEETSARNHEEFVNHLVVDERRFEKIHEDLTSLQVKHAKEGRKAGAISGGGIGVALVALIEGLKYYAGQYIKIKSGR